jgi:hypothetical protein
MTMSDRSVLLGKAYQAATKELRNHHAEEFHMLLQEQYDAMGLDVRKRLTGERKREADIEKAKAVLAALEAKAL